MEDHCKSKININDRNLVLCYNLIVYDMCRNVLFLFVFLIGLFFISSCTNRTTTISGSVGKQTKLLYSNPDLAVCYDGFLDTLVPDDQGRFELRLDLKEGRFIFIRTSGSRYNKYLLPVQPGEKYKISIDENNGLLAYGPNEAGIELYQSVWNEGLRPMAMDWGAFFENDTFSRDEMIEKVKQEELTGFKKLLDNKKITRSFYKLIAGDRDCFYASISAELYLQDMLKIYRSPKTDNSILAEENTMKQLQNIFDRYKPDDKNLMKSPSWTKYALSMYTKFYKQYFAKHINRDNIESLINADSHFSFWFEQIRQSFRGETLEPVLALLIYRDGGVSSNKLVKASIPVFQYFKEKYPGSPYLPYFQSPMNRMLAFYTGSELDPSIRFIESGDSIDSFSELISQLKGKKLYVDIWGNWCAYCREEFQYKDSLEVILKQNNVTPLYISLDEVNQGKTWEALVYTYNLRGIHFRANRAFIDDLNKLYRDEKNENPGGNEKKSFSIPWYMLIDENGNILEKQARRPSEIVSTKRLSD